MNTQADKAQDNKSKQVLNTAAQNKNSSSSAFEFVNNRPEAIAQRKLQEMANNSQQAKHSAQLQTMSDNYSVQQIKVIQKKENNTGLPDQLKSGIENLSGFSMDDVKVHYNSDKPAPLQAHAYAQGTDIHIAPGQEIYLPHEAWHVVQQKQGRVRPTLQMKGGANVNDDVGLEKEADIMGANALNFRSINTHQQNLEGINSPSVAQLCINPIQIGVDKKTNERLKEFISYAESMIEKAEIRGFDTMKDGELSPESDSWYRVSEEFSKFIPNVNAVQKLSDHEIPELIETLVDNINDLNDSYEAVKKVNFEDGKSEVDSDDKNKPPVENSFKAEINALPDKAGIAQFGIKGKQILSIGNAKVISTLCKKMIDLKEEMIHGNGNALIRWMELFNDLFGFIQKLSKSNPAEYMALIQMRIIETISSTDKMVDGGEMCNEELPSRILDQLK